MFSSLKNTKFDIKFDSKSYVLWGERGEGKTDKPVVDVFGNILQRKLYNFKNL